MQYKYQVWLVFCLVTLTLLLHSTATAAGWTWAKRYNEIGNSDDYAAALTVDSAGNVIVTGSAYVSETHGYDYATVKYDGVTGKALWVRHYNGGWSGADCAAAVKVDSQDNVLVTGSSFGGPNQGYDFVTVKYNGATGAVLWTKRYNDANGDDRAYALAIDSANNVFVTGTADRGTSNGSDYTTIKYDGATGNILWTRHYNGRGSGWDAAYAIGVDKAGNVFVTGGSYGGAVTLGDYVTIKYNGATGAMLWSHRYNAAGNSYEYAAALTVDSVGNVIVTGGAYTSAALGYDYLTVKYDGATGNILWSRRHDGLASGDDYATAVKVDSQNNVVVTGYVWAGATHNDLVTIKYSGATGATLWRKRYNKVFNGNDEAYALAIDSANNVVVAGCTFNGDMCGYDYIVMKYNGATGGILWYKTFNGPGSGDDRAVAVATDRLNNIFVTGSSFGSQITYQDYGTLKHSP